MPKRKHTFSTQASNCDAGTRIRAKRHKLPQTSRSQQLRLLTHMAPSGGLKEFEEKYQQTDALGQGGFGSVYAGTRKSDDLPVAIKHILKLDVEYIPVISQGQLYHIPTEVFLMVKAAGGPERLGQSASVTLLEWFEVNNSILLVMERPVPSIDLWSMLHKPLPENTGKEIMKQLILAMIDLHNKRIFHRDIKPENILIQDVPNGLRVRIIDFGCGCNVLNYPYSGYSGTPCFSPPELFQSRCYNDISTSVWQLGAVTYELIKNYTDKDFTTNDYVSGNLTVTSDVSKECTDFLTSCLKIDPLKRITLDQMSQHPWFQDATVAQ